LKLSNQVPGRFSSRGQINGERFRRDSSSAVRGNAQGLTAVTWVTRVGRGRGCSGGTAVTEAAAELGSSVAVFRWPEGQKVVEKCLESFVRMMWCRSCT
jgi:hypothetical protein